MSQPAGNLSAMPKKDFFSPKSIANRWKAKGLQKLRWYCQMCQKQCRDENGFKCHTMSESHLRQMAVFTESPDGTWPPHSCWASAPYLTTRVRFAWDVQP